MRYRPSNGWIVVLALGVGAVVAPSIASGQEANAVESVDADAAQQRLAELAERYSATSAGSSAGNLDAVGEVSEDLEQRPLGPTDAEGQVISDGLGEPSGGGTLTTLAALGLVIGLIFAARWAYTKMGGKVVARSSPVVEVLSRTAVAPKSHVLLIRVAGRVLVVGDGGGNLNTLASLDDPEEVAGILQSVTAQQPSSVSRSFNAMVSRFQGDLDGKANPREEGGDQAEVHVDRTRDALSGLASRLRTLGSGREDAA